MDELLDFMGVDDSPSPKNVELEEIPEEPVPAPKEKETKTTPIKKPLTDKITFNDMFGSPDKRDVKEFGLDKNSEDARSKTSPGTSRSSLLSDHDRKQMALQREIKQDKNVPYKPEPSMVVIDPYSRVRLLKTSISIYYDDTMTPEAVLKDRNIGLEFVPLISFPSWYRSKGKDQKNFWISGVLVRKTPGVKKSANGNDYCIWEISDLKELDKKTTVFLFGAVGSASSPVLPTPVGSVIDITTPNIMNDTSSGTIKFSVMNTNQVRFIAQAKDFGYCQSKKKDGNKCTAVVNTWECNFCVHHASYELKKLNIGSGKGKGVSKSGPGGGFRKSGSGMGSAPYSEGDPGKMKQHGVFIADFGGPRSSQSPKVTSRPNLPPSSRMALQGGVNQMNKNPVKFGNPDTVKFVGNGGEQHRLMKEEKVVVPVTRKPLDLNPTKTRHLTDKDRDLLSMLDAKSSSQGTESPSTCTPVNSAVPPVMEMIATSIVNAPSAASRNFLQFLSLQHAPKDQVDLTSANKSSCIQPMTMSRAKVKSMEKALDFVKKNGPIKKANPNATKASQKRKFDQVKTPESGKAAGTKRRHTEIDVEFDFDTDKLKDIINAKSAHDDELDQIQHDEYFGKLEKKEALENKLLNTFTIETNAVMCRQCKYVALSQGEFCKQQMHQVRLVKAQKRFFKCKDCGNRTMSLDRLPKRPCSNCNSSSWLSAPVGRERKGPTLPSEMLAVRGNEEKFIGAAGSKMFMHLEV